MKSTQPLRGSKISYKTSKPNIDAANKSRHFLGGDYSLQCTFYVRIFQLIFIISSFYHSLKAEPSSKKTKSAKFDGQNTTLTSVKTVILIEIKVKNLKQDFLNVMNEL